MHRPRRHAAQFFAINDFGYDAPPAGALWQVAVGRAKRPAAALLEINDLGLCGCWISFRWWHLDELPCAQLKDVLLCGAELGERNDVSRPGI